jgi:hypothetical protein
MKHFSAIANRELLVLVAIVASAVTLHIRQQMTPATTADTQAPVHAQFGRMCSPSAKDVDKPRALPADCEMRANLPKAKPLQTWV